MSCIVLSTLNARYTHTAFGLRYLLANMGDLQDRTTLREFVIQDSTVEVLAQILAENPRIVGFGVYIWNVEPLTRLVAELKRVRPEVVVVLGGPEVSYETESQPIIQLADYVICGEGDLSFRDLCRSLLSGQAPESRIIQATLPQMTELQLPYDLYTDEDVANRVIYVEASRGCPFTCEFCLSALEIPVRQADLDRFLAAMDGLLERGARRFKFVDRTFNLNLKVSRRILEFFLERWQDDLFLHFEMIPDRLPESLRSLIARFPPGALQFEIGVQTFDEQTGALISRRQDNALLEENFRFLRQQTGVHVHADLIVGLPGESWSSFAAGFDRLYRLDPQEIQIGILKRLKGTPIVRHDDEWQMVYSPHPPFEILSNRLLTFEQIHELRRIARYWDLIGNSGNFVATRRLLLSAAESRFAEFRELCLWLFEHEPRMQGIALVRLMELIFDFAVTERQRSEQEMAESLWSDYQRIGRRDVPEFLRRFELPSPPRPSRRTSQLPPRQRRHAEASVDPENRGHETRSSPQSDNDDKCRSDA